MNAAKMALPRRPTPMNQGLHYTRFRAFCQTRLSANQQLALRDIPKISGSEGRIAEVGLIRRQARNLNQRPDFDRANARSGNSAGDVDRIAEILRFNEKIIGELLVRFDKRTIRNE